MTTIPRRTLAAEARFEGTGIHSGAPCRLAIRPAGAGTGILLRHAGSDAPPLEAHIRHADAARSDRRTVLVGPEGQVFEQLEHVMAALAAAGITDAELEQQGPEPPFLGGGSLEFSRGIADAGVADPGGTIAPLVVDRPVSLTDGDAELVATPHDGLRLSVFVEFPGTIVGSAGFSIEVDEASFAAEVAAARTFALERDIEALRAAGLAKGGNLQNAVVFNAGRYLNEGLFYPDEVVRHKVIDLLGDLALLAGPLRGHFWAWRAGHRSHVRFAQMLSKEFKAP
jgi:UDP-3-O-[3-hydroxymyristoyl] N-acetylglucosamine deacetylase